MAAIHRKMYGNRWAFVCFIIITVNILAAYAAFAQGRTKTMNYKIVHHNIQREEIKAGDVSGNTLHAGENQGLAIFDNGELASKKV